MGVQRQAAKINWITSMGMIVMAGTIFRMRGVFKKMSKVTIRDLQERAGKIHRSQPEQLSILPRPVSTTPGKWSQILKYRQQYRLFTRLYIFSEGPFKRTP